LTPCKGPARAGGSKGRERERERRRRKRGGESQNEGEREASGREESTLSKISQSITAPPLQPTSLSPHTHAQTLETLYNLSSIIHKGRPATPFHPYPHPRHPSISPRYESSSINSQELEALESGEHLQDDETPTASPFSVNQSPSDIRPLILHTYSPNQHATPPSSPALSFSIQELEALESGENVYKMMGPVLLRVEVEDAKQNVGKRLELIKGSM
jgi:hypothetical protein